ncbi:MAG: lysozyme inhibitor LprI family protein [Anaerolineaceae bacterium]
MNKIRLHMQSISLLSLAGILLVIAFYISLQTQTGEKEPGLTVTPRTEKNSLIDMPNCSEELPIQDAISCHLEAAQVSDALVQSLESSLVQLEPKAVDQLALIENQIAWEESRNTECHLVREMSGSSDEGQLQELICLTELNLTRLARLEQYCNEWHGLKDCGNGVEANQ